MSDAVASQVRMDGQEAGSRARAQGHGCRSAGCASGDRSGLWACCRGRRGFPGSLRAGAAPEGEGKGEGERSAAEAPRL